MTALALHGFLGDGDDWRGFAAAVPTIDLAAPDLPGHGHDPAPAPPDFFAWVAWVVGRVRTAERPVHLLGYSMGGRLALAAAMEPACRGRLASLALLGASPGLADADERAARVAADGSRARALARDGLPRFLDAWYRQPLFAPACEAVGHAALVARRRDGQPAALAEALRTVGTGTMPDLRPGLPRLRVPTLVLAGERDEKFQRLGREIADAVPDGRFATVAGAGHALLLEAPARCAALWSEFLQRSIDPKGELR